MVYIDRCKSNCHTIAVTVRHPRQWRLVVLKDRTDMSLILNCYFFFMNLDHCWIDDLKDVLKSVQQADWKQVIPLREDISLCQLSPLADIHNTIEFTVKRRGQLNEVQEVKF